MGYSMNAFVNTATIFLVLTLDFFEYDSGLLRFVLSGDVPLDFFICILGFFALNDLRSRR